MLEAWVADEFLGTWEVTSLAAAYAQTSRFVEASILIFHVGRPVISILLLLS